MKITDIRQQVKRTDRCSIFVDGKYCFAFSLSELAVSGLRIGQEFTESELIELKDRAVIDKGLDSSLGLIMRRPRSEWELREYLKRKEYVPEVTDKILDKLTAKGYVNDQDFARRWVENRRLLKSTSRRRLNQELRQKRIANDIIQQVLEADETDEQQVLQDLIIKMRTRSRYQDSTKLMQYLLRQGYNYGDIKQAMAEPQET